MRPLPADREKALAAIAAGWGREPSLAHPDCLCGKPIPQPPRPPNVIDDRDGYIAWVRQHRAWVNGRRWYFRSDCPMHRPERGRR